MTEPVTFSAFLARRRALWWDTPWLGLGSSATDAVHRAFERRRRRDRQDPEPAWRCCRHWPRTLIDKWNGREFAARHGCPLPALLWYGTDPGAIPFASLPEEFVIRPRFGRHSEGVSAVVRGVELLHGGPATTDALLGELPRTRTLRRPAPVLVEEFVRSWGQRDALPREYKCHTFGGRVAAVQVVAPPSANEGLSGFYTPQWERVHWPHQSDQDPDPIDLPPPAWLGEMLARAEAVGGAIGTYMRIDFFAGSDGFVFDEFASIPNGGERFTPYFDDWFGRIWSEWIPDRP